MSVGGWDSQLDEVEVEVETRTADLVDDPPTVDPRPSTVKKAFFLNPTHDILDTMSDRKLGERWTVQQICDDTGLTGEVAEDSLSHLQTVDLVQWHETPYGRQGWGMTDLGASFVGVLQRRTATRR